MLQNFYLEHPVVTARPEAEADAWRRENNITVQGSGIPKPWYVPRKPARPPSSSLALIFLVQLEL